MTRITIPASIEDAPAGSQPLLEGVKAKLGMTSNLYRLLALSPPVFEGYLALVGSLAKTALDARTREQIALAVANVNGCNYCNAAHTAVAKRLKLDPAEIEAARRGKASDPKTAAIVGFARHIAVSRAAVSEAEVEAVRAAGVSDAELVETVVLVAVNVLTNYVNETFKTPVDFPETTPATRVA